MKYQNLSVLIILIKIISTFSQNYIHQEFQGNIDNSEWNISIYLKEWKGIILYALDLNVRILIEFERRNKSFSNIILQYNEMIENTNIQNLCGCNNCLVKYLQFYLNFKRKDAIISCNNNQSVSIKLISYSPVLNLKADKLLPIPENYYTESNKIFIWMGNTGHYIGYNNITYFPSKEQLIGCLDYFYFNNALIKMKYSENQFKSYCKTNSINKTICNSTQCFTTSIEVNMFDCSQTIINETYCEKTELSNFSADKYPYIRRSNTTKPLSISFFWKQNRLNSDCLLEIQTKIKSSIIFTINPKNQIVMYIFNDVKSNKTLGEVKVNTINKLLIEFSLTRLIVNISSGNRINTFIDEFSDEPIKIILGKSSVNGLCKTYEGHYNFQSNPYFMTLSEFKYSKSKSETNYNITILLGIFVLFCCCLLTCYCFALKKMKTEFEKKKSELNPIVHRTPLESYYSDSLSNFENNQYANISVTDKNYGIIITATI